MDLNLIISLENPLEAAPLSKSYIQWVAEEFSLAGGRYWFYSPIVWGWKVIISLDTQKYPEPCVQRENKILKGFSFVHSHKREKKYTQIFIGHNRSAGFDGSWWNMGNPIKIKIKIPLQMVEKYLVIFTRAWERSPKS